MLGDRVTQSPRPQLQGLSSSQRAGEAGGGQPVRTAPSTAARPGKLSASSLYPPALKPQDVSSGQTAPSYPSQKAGSLLCLSPPRPWSRPPRMVGAACGPPLPPSAAARPLATPASCTGPLRRSLNSPMPHLFPNHRAATQSGSRSKYRRLDDVACGSHITIHYTGLLPLFPDSLATLQCLSSGLCRSAHSNLILSLSCKNPP